MSLFHPNLEDSLLHREFFVDRRSLSALRICHSSVFWPPLCPVRAQLPVTSLRCVSYQYEACLLLSLLPESLSWSLSVWLWWVWFSMLILLVDILESFSQCISPNLGRSGPLYVKYFSPHFSFLSWGSKETYVAVFNIVLKISETLLMFPQSFLSSCAFQFGEFLLIHLPSSWFLSSIISHFIWCPAGVFKHFSPVTALFSSRISIWF